MNVLLAFTGLFTITQLSQAQGQALTNKDVCSLPSVTGPCSAAFPRWFYDIKIGKCSPFIYGGCDGNKNNFRTLEECEKKCDSEKTAEYPCFRALQKALYLSVHGERKTTYAYKKHRLPTCDHKGYFIPKQCHLANGECWCVSKLGREIPNTRKQDTNVTCDVCNLPKVAGPCKATFKRWFFNKDSGKCDQFAYGGCQGNGNNFEGQEECHAMCLPHKLRTEEVPSKCQSELLQATQRPMPGRFSPRCNPDGSYHLIQCHPSTGFCWCSHPDGTKYPGSDVRGRPKCDMYKKLPAVATMFAALSAPSKCQQQLLEAIQKPLMGRFKPRCNSDGSYETVQCHPSTGFCWCSNPDGIRYPGSEIRGRPDCAKYTSLPQVMSLVTAVPASSKEDICSLSYVTGPCRAGFPRWFYNIKTGRCSQFIYGGCDGNKNNFRTLQECEKKCDSEKTAEYPCFRGLQKALSPAVYGKPVPTNESSRLPECDNKGYFNHKQCDSTSGECWCVNKLGKEIMNTRKPNAEVTCDVCSLPKVNGPCNAAFRRWFYNKASGKCEQFVYGGCHGNENNFERQEECQAMCLPHKLRVEKTPSKCQFEALQATQKMLVGRFTPRCNPDGSYHLIQCHPSTGFCWCSHPDGTKYPSTYVRGKPNCKKYLSLPKVTSLFAAVPAPSKCQQELLQATQRPLLGSFKPRCNPDGSYETIQCHPSTGFCWCSKPDGTKYPGSEVRGRPNCAKFTSQPQVTSLFAAVPPSSKCQQELLRATQRPLLGSFKPRCNPDGSYETIQCHPSTGFCWCSKPDGTKYPGSEVRGRPNCAQFTSQPQVTSILAAVPALSKCQQKAKLATRSKRALMGQFIPRCNEDGTYKLIQCHGSTGYCWCSDPAGTKFTGTEVPPGQKINCDNYIGKTAAEIETTIPLVEAAEEDKLLNQSGNDSPSAGSTTTIVVVIAVIAFLCLVIIGSAVLLRKRHSVKDKYEKLPESTFETLKTEHKPLINA